MTEQELKKCHSCLQLKDREKEYHNDASASDGKRRMCKSCAKEYSADWYGRNVDRKRKDALARYHNSKR